MQASYLFYFEPVNVGNAGLACGYEGLPGLAPVYVGPRCFNSG